ncbi:MAG: Polyphosphate kinase 2 [uncultured Pyrinomonadaceae bacterium]|uniref:Polyphosphate kinase 2 n=1 Tax=uncultured Pyrinomonadaceae bacterium TaxID=2283094 RepID=A0A6J4N6W7_9BACT|nr:MAG: Polyphosphate kinase 2 [uncultured Pyrinomonadaceae bacterium]
MNHEQFIYQPDKKQRLADFDPDFTNGFGSEREAQERMQEDVAEMAKYHDILMAHETNGLLVVFQAMDGAGKDATIKNVMSALDPQGCEMKMFKAQTEKELKHDYLRHAAQSVPARGQIGIFNRSYYEHVIVERIHPEKLEQQKLPRAAMKKDIWEKRFRHINNFEEYLLDNGIHTLKFFLNLSKDEQREKLLERMERNDKRWKFSREDLEDREHWDEYMKVYEEAFERTSTEIAPWHIIPDNHRWFARAAVASIILAKLKSLHAQYPTADEKQKKEMAQARKSLRREKPTTKK